MINGLGTKGKKGVLKSTKTTETSIIFIAFEKSELDISLSNLYWYKTSSIYAYFLNTLCINLIGQVQGFVQIFFSHCRF